MRRTFPFIPASVMQPVLRCSVALVFFLHAMVRVFNNTIPQFAGFLENAGLPFGKVIVVTITAFEIAGSVLLAIGVWVRLISAALFVLLLIGIILIHWANGWFVGEHGVGGMEYSFVLMITLMVVAANGTGHRPRTPDSRS
ncbi:MAG: DoxX family protein [Chitinophagaceae bacterium]